PELDTLAITSPLPPRYALLMLDVRQDDTSRSSPDAVQRRLAQVAERIAVSAFAASMIVLEARIGRDSANPYEIVLREDAGGVPVFRFARPRSNAFSNRGLGEFLQASDVNHLFLAGRDAVGSISKTARAALNQGLRVTFIRDAIVTRHDDKWS